MGALGSDASRGRLRDELKRLRVKSGLSMRSFAERSGIAQSTISRIESGEQKTIKLDQLVAWARAAEAPDDKLAELLALNEQIALGPSSWDEASETGSTDFAVEVRDLEAQTGVLSNYQPAAIPGLLQTPAYARRLLSSGPNGAPGDLAERVMARMERQHILSDETKLFRFVIPEVALRWPYGPPDDPAVLDEQRDQLAVIEARMGRPNIRIAVLPMRPVGVWRLGGFVIFDEVADGDPQVHLEWLTRPYNITDAEQVEMCREAFANLLGASVEGDEAHSVIATAARDLRT